MHTPAEHDAGGSRSSSMTSSGGKVERPPTTSLRTVRETTISIFSLTRQLVQNDPQPNQQHY